MGDGGYNGVGGAASARRVSECTVEGGGVAVGSREEFSFSLPRFRVC